MNQRAHACFGARLISIHRIKTPCVNDVDAHRRQAQAARHALPA